MIIVNNVKASKLMLACLNAKWYVWIDVNYIKFRTESKL